MKVGTSVQNPAASYRQSADLVASITQEDGWLPPPRFPSVLIADTHVASAYHSPAEGSTQAVAGHSADDGAHTKQTSQLPWLHVDHPSHAVRCTIHQHMALCQPLVVRKDPQLASCCAQLLTVLAQAVHGIEPSPSVSTGTTTPAQVPYSDAAQVRQGEEEEEEELQSWAVPLVQGKQGTEPGTPPVAEKQRRSSGAVSTAHGGSATSSPGHPDAIHTLGPISLSGRLVDTRLGKITTHQHQAAMALLSHKKAAMQLTGNSIQQALQSEPGEAMLHYGAVPKLRFNTRAKDGQYPITAGCVGPPFHRYLRCDSAKASEAEARGSGWYSVRQPEVRAVTLQGGLPEVQDCMSAWPSRRLVVELPLCSLTAPGLAAGGASGLQPDSVSSKGDLLDQQGVRPTPWCVELSTEAQHHLQQQFTHAKGSAREAPVQQDSGGTPALDVALHALAAWLPGGLLCNPAAVVDALSSQSQQQQIVLDVGSCSQWGSASVSLRWWSCATHEPLRWDPADRVIVQVHGSTRALVVPPCLGLTGLCPCPSTHPHAGYSAPCVAAAAACSRPHNPASHQPSDANGRARFQEQCLKAVMDLWPGFAAVRAVPCLLHPGDALWVPAGCSLQLESLTSPAEGDKTLGIPPSSNSNTGTPAGLQGGVLMTLTLAASGSGSVPRCRGALELRASHLAEGWAGAVVGARTPRVRELLLLLACRLDLSARPHRLQVPASTSLEREQEDKQGLSADAAAAAGTSEGAPRQDRLGNGQRPDGGSRGRGAVQAASVGPAGWVTFQSPSVGGAHTERRAGPVGGGGSSQSEGTPPVGAPAPGSSSFTPCVPAHWVSMRGQSCWLAGIEEANTATSVRPAASSEDEWPPTWEPGTLAGSAQVQLGVRVLSMAEGVAAVPWSQQEVVEVMRVRQVLGLKEYMGRGGDPLGLDSQGEEAALSELAWAGCPEAASHTGLGLSCGSLTCQWPLGAAAARLLRRVCADRLLPTTWLNKLAHVEPLLLGDIGFKYTVEFRSENEARFPELFQPQLARRERAAVAAARTAHTQDLRRLQRSSEARLQLGQGDKIGDSVGVEGDEGRERQ